MRAIDATYQLKDRVATALGLTGKLPEDSPWRLLQLSDTEWHLSQVDPVRVAPVITPRPWYWGIACSVAAVLLGWLAVPAVPLSAAVVINDVVVAQADRLERSLEELEEIRKGQDDAEIEQLLKELQETIEELRQPGVEPKEALALLSEMEAVLEQAHQQLTDPGSEASLKAVGAALALAEPMQAAGRLLGSGELEKAASALERLDLPKLDRQTERAVTETLDRLQRDSSASLPMQLRESIDRISQGLCAGDRGQFLDGIKGLAGECRKQGIRRRIADMLRRQSQCLGECKSACEGACRNLAQSSSPKKGGHNWGLAASGNVPEDPTPLLNASPELRITGMESDSGDVDVETVQAPEQQQEAVRRYRENAETYQQLSESALESEPIPLGHRQTIRRYFEMIRPQRSSDAPADSTSD